MNNYSEQADTIARYLVGRPASNKVKKLYEFAIKQGITSAEENDKILRYWIKHPWSLELLDSGLAITNGNAELRRRIYVMFAILESFPEYSKFFLARKAFILSPAILITGIRAVTMAILGVIFVKVIGRS